MFSRFGALARDILQVHGRHTKAAVRADTLGTQSMISGLRRLARISRRPLCAAGPSRRLACTFERLGNDISSLSQIRVAYVTTTIGH